LKFFFSEKNDQIRISDGEGFCFGGAGGSNVIINETVVLIDGTLEPLTDFLIYNEPKKMVTCWNPVAGSEVTCKPTQWQCQVIKSQKYMSIDYRFFFKFHHHHHSKDKHLNGRRLML
jgi:hypothetical protein